jgi:hypothetical protein
LSRCVGVFVVFICCIRCILLGDWRIRSKHIVHKLELNSTVWVRERTIPTEYRRLSEKWLPTFADRGCHVVSVTDPYGRVLGFLDRNRYFSIK